MALSTQLSLRALLSRGSRLPTVGAAEAVAAIIHLHARDPKTGRPDQTTEGFARLLRQVKQRRLTSPRVVAPMCAPTSARSPRAPMRSEVRKASAGKSRRLKCFSSKAATPSASDGPVIETDRLMPNGEAR